MWIALKDAPIHECSGIALVRIADHIPLIRLHFLGQLPLAPGRKSGTTAPAQSGRFHFLDHVVRRHPGKDTLQSGVTPVGQNVAEILRIHLPATPQNNTHLRIWILDQKLIDYTAVLKTLGNNPSDIRRKNIAIGHARGKQLNAKTLVIDTHVQSPEDRHLRVQCGYFDLLLE